MKGNRFLVFGASQVVANAGGGNSNDSNKEWGSTQSNPN